LTFCEEASDDESIADAELLVRAIHPRQWARISGQAETLRPLRIAFNESSDGTGASVNLSSVLQAHGLEKTFVASALKTKWKDHGFVEFAAAVPRSHAAKVVRHPLSDNPAHAAICGLSDEAKTDLSRKSIVISVGNPQPHK
jgi:hypothetical protein